MKVSEIEISMAPKFGTSGLRGLVSELTPELIADYTLAFLSSCDTGGRIWIGHDLRASSPAFSQVIADTAFKAGVEVILAGPVPTPALALAAAGAGAVMVTGSHIPADRNGLKFYTRAGEITKEDENAITASLGRHAADGGPGRVYRAPEVGERFADRYTKAFGPTALVGRKVGVYSHSAVGRDLLMATLQRLGAQVVELDRSASFVPVDTEAVEPDTRGSLKKWAAAHCLDAIVSMDGDSDRPLVTDETGCVVPGDILGQITAEFLGAEAVVTPISSNSGVTEKTCFSRVMRTRIGSPFVIAGMKEAGGKVVGYEANGGFLLGFTADAPHGAIEPLPTRDSFLPIIATLVASSDVPVSVRVGREPSRFTASDRLQDVPLAAMQALVSILAESSNARATFLAGFGLHETGLDLTDGVRMSTSTGRILHVRPSGNAPELRLYVEASDPSEAEETLVTGLALLRKQLFHQSFDHQEFHS